MIHAYSLNGYHIALDVYSGAIHLMDKVSLEAVRLYENHSREETIARLLDMFPGQTELNEGAAEKLLKELDKLKAAGKLYSQDGFLGQAGKLKNDGAVIKALCLHVAHACNLACSYCFAGQGKYQGKAAFMSPEVGRKALDFLIEHSGSRRHLEVDFFGGEPLLNWELVKELVAYGRGLEKTHGKVFRFTLTTNGMLLNDEVIDFCCREMQNVVLSLDGRKEVHDRFRVDNKGQGSYESAVPKFQRFAQARGEKGYYIRGTYTRHNLDFLEDVLHMADLGFTQLSMEPVVTGPENPSAIREEDLPVLYSQYERLAVEMLSRKRQGRGFDFYHYNIDLAHGPCIYKRLSGCGSGTEYLAVTPAGDLYPCHQFVGEESYKLGDLEHGITNAGLQEEFLNNNLYAHPECADCWAKFYCAGGCAANACHASGSIHGVYGLGCELLRKRMECAIMLQAGLLEEGSTRN